VTQKPFVHGVPLQHCAELVHCCPYCEQVVPPPGVVVPLSVPGAGGVADAPQVPLVAPAATLHGEPEQQSAVVVQVAPLGWHAAPEQTRTPAAFGVQGSLQQSALDAQAVPAGGGLVAQSTPFVARQRGMPRLSWTQLVLTCWTVPEQQRSVAWQENAERRQMEPAGLHLLPWSQRPTEAPAALLHVVFASEPSGRPAEPQQSLSC
jgi:hypothetical protein